MRPCRCQIARQRPGHLARIPPADPSKLERVKQYLVHQRRIDPGLLDPLVQSGIVYGDTRANAVFLLLGKENLPVGAELRGTTARPWRGLAPGSQKDLGFFAVVHRAMAGHRRCRQPDHSL